VGHQISTAYEMGWSTLSNGELLTVAEDLFDLLITTDQNLRYQQQLTGRHLAIMILPPQAGQKSGAMLSSSQIK
jgi:hypothetical protein